MSTDAVSTDQDTPGTSTTRPARRRLPRRPVRRSLVVTHRWTSLVLGLLLVIETTAGAVLLFRGEAFRAGHDGFYQHTATAHPITAAQALAAVRAAHPDFPAAWVSADNGILAVGDPDYRAAYAVDPGTGRVSDRADLNGGVFGWLANLHDCAFTCAGYPGYLPALAATAPVVGVTWGALLLGALGLLMVLLAVTGIIVWWPGIRRLGTRFRVRANRGRFARDFDLHNLVGAIAVPFLLMWGVTGAAFEFPFVQNAWLTITGGHTESADRFTFTADPAPATAPRLTPDAAADAAVRRFGGEVRYLVLPQPAADYYTVSLATGTKPYAHRAFFGGDTTVYVDGHNAAHLSVVDSTDRAPVANNFYHRVFEPSHFGWQVNGWWRMLWLGLGLSPLLLALTGLSTWLVRRGNQRRRRRAATG